MQGSQQFHDSIIEHLTQNKPTLEQILKDEIIDIQTNKIINFGQKNNYEIDLYIKTKNSNFPTLIEVKSNNGNPLKNKFYKQLKIFENDYPNSNIYFVYSQCGTDKTNLQFEYFPPHKTPKIEYY